MPYLECVERIFHLFDQYEACSGLKADYTKTEAGLDHLPPLELKWVNSVKALRIVFTYKESGRKKLQIKRYSDADATVALQRSLTVR